MRFDLRREGRIISWKGLFWNLLMIIPANVPPFMSSTVSSDTLIRTALNIVINSDIGGLFESGPT